jgi:hypothetical protein
MADDVTLENKSWYTVAAVANDDDDDDIVIQWHRQKM